MKGKRGSIEISWEFIAHLVFAIALILAILWGTKAILSLMGKSKAQCANDIYWSNPHGLEDTLKRIDNGENANFFFLNNGCSLASFSFVQGASKIEYPSALPREPLLCLCKIEDNICKPYDCYKFKNYDQIDSKQFSTENLEKYVFLKFTRDGRTLRVDAIGTEKAPEQKGYTRSDPELTAKIDPSGLIHTLNIIFMSREIEGFNPIVEITETGLLPPQGIENVEGFTTLFSIRLAQPPLYGQALDDYVANPREIAPNQVKAAVMIISVPNEKYQKLSAIQKQNIRLYYQKDQEWKNIPMICESSETETLCGVRLNEFSNSFAVSVEIIEDFHEDVGEETGLTEDVQQEYIYLLDDPELQQKINIVKYNLDELKLGGLGTGSTRSLSDIDLIVIHHTGGSRATYSPDGIYPGALQTLQKRGLSSHYILDKDGTLHYLVPENVVAWHAGCCKNQAYNTSTDDWVEPRKCCEEITYEGEIICKYRNRFCREGTNLRSIGIEIVNTGKPNDQFTEEQYYTLNQLLQFLTSELGISYDDDTIISHYEVTSNKDDPQYIDWDKLNLPNHIAYNKFKETYAYA